MNKLIKPGRFAFMIVMVAVLIASYMVVLYKLQIVEGAAYYEESTNSQTRKETVVAARGNIMDRYGRILVSNKECNNITINASNLFGDESAETIDKANACLLDMVAMARECGDEYIDELPVTSETPFEYTDMSSIQKTRLAAYISRHGLDENCTAVELMSYFRTRYDINNNYTAEEMRIVSGIRYEINVRYAINTADYIFVEDASNELVTRLLEKYSDFVEITTSYVREYNTQYASHLLGYVGLMDGSEMERYERLGYSKNAKVGKDGTEYAFEDWLHGLDGEALVTRTSTGVITSTVDTTDPEPGNHVYLTIDIQMQEAAERALTAGIEEMQRERDEDNKTAEQENKPEDVKEPITGGGIVVVDVNSGEPLAIASYPTYDLTNFIENYDEIKAEENDPLFNRALFGAYAPGSTFKPCTAIACLTEGIMNTEDKVKCEGVFTKYEYAGFAPQCWIVQQHALHGEENTELAIRDSCNYYFYTWGDLLGVDKLGEYANNFGLGVPTGIELPETSGHMANRVDHEALTGEPWTQGQVLQAAIGQSDSLFTPLQLAEYCAAVANCGTRYSADILKSVRSFDYSETLYTKKSEVLSTVESADYNWAAVHRGMYMVANDPVGSAYASLYGYSYNGERIGVAAKTGTSQLGEDRTNNAIFICFAPYDDPQVAIAIVVEHGASGSKLGVIAKDVLDAYFGIQSASTTVEKDNTLLR